MVAAFVSVLVKKMMDDEGDRKGAKEEVGDETDDRRGAHDEHVESVAKGRPAATSLCVVCLSRKGASSRHLLVHATCVVGRSAII